MAHAVFTAAELITHHGSDIARIVRGELAELSEEERREILGSRMSYYPRGPDGGRVERCVFVRHARRRNADRATAGICEHAVAGVPVLRWCPQSRPGNGL